MELLEQIKQAGIIGAGGAGFPTHAKLASKSEYILMNGAECEPLLRVDQQLMEEFPDDIILGFWDAGQLVGAEHAIIGIKGKHIRVITLLRERIEALGLHGKVSVGELPDIYPAGDEQVLVYELTGRVVPEVGIPIQVGCVVINSETALNIRHAQDGFPITEKYITLAGDIPNRMTVKVPIGTPIIDVLKLSGIESFDDYAVIDGGPMMGPVMPGIDGYVTKKNKGFVILKKKHPLIRRKTVTIEQSKRINKAACEQCRMCTDMCPRYLLGHNMQPHMMMRALGYKLDSLEGQKTAQLCCQCNLCELFACPANLFPRSANTYFKDRLAEQCLRYQPDKKTFEIRKNRQYRMIPSKRLIARLGLHDFDKPAPLVETTVVPDLVRIATRQHVGAPAEPIVSVGEHVSIGQMIGKIPAESLGAAIHASIPGIVTEVGKDFIEIRRG